VYIFASNGSGIYNTSIKVIIQICIETNIRQRGIGNPNPIKLGRCIKELERIYGVREGSANQKGINIKWQNRIIRLWQNLNPTSPHKWVYQ